MDHYLSMTAPLLHGENESPFSDVESPPINPNSTNKSNNTDITVTVDTASLKSKIIECRQRLVSGKMGFGVASTPGNCGHQDAKRMTTAPFVDSFDAELCRISDVLLNLRLSAESSAVAMLKQADIISHSKDMMEVSTLKSEAISLQSRIARIGQVTRDNISELTRIALEADSQLGTTSAVKANRCFESEPWVDSGSIVIFLSDIFSILRSVEESSDAKKDGKWVAPSSFERVTTKFWVTDDKLPDVLTKSVAELPLLVYGRTGLLQKDINNPQKEDLWRSLKGLKSRVRIL